MTTVFCLNCGQQVAAKRHIGVGTLIMLACTLGWGIIAVVLGYKKRCAICLDTNFRSSNDE